MLKFMKTMLVGLVLKAGVIHEDSGVSKHLRIQLLIGWLFSLQAGLAGLTSDLLAAKAPFSPSQDEKETNGSLLAGLVFHEAYHNGQLGTLRRLSGAAGVIK